MRLRPQCSQRRGKRDYGLFVAVGAVSVRDMAELYDDTDIRELTNLAADLNSAGLRVKLRARLEQSARNLGMGVAPGSRAPA